VKVHWQSLHVEPFLIMIGDYESMLILQDNAPDDCISMDVNSLILFARYKRGEKGTPLTDLSGKVINDVDGKVIKCSNDWKDPNNVDGFHSAVRLLHDSHGHCGQYEDHCHKCLELAPEDQFKGCRSHSKNPRLMRRGNPVVSQAWKDCVLASDKDGEHYVRRGCSQLLPSDLRCLRAYLLSCNCLPALQLLVIIFLAVRLFLRSDEFANIKFEDILEGSTIVKENGVEGVVLKVKGKYDDAPRNLTLWADDECPDLCAVRLLLVYLFLTGIKGGYLFPDNVELNNMPADGICRTRLSKKKLMSRLPRLFVDVLKKADMRLGTHTFRKTAYLLAVWGGGEISDIMFSARHKSLQEAEGYRLDAQGLLETAKIHNDPMESVSHWRSIRRESDTNHRSLNAPSIPYQRPLVALAEDFVYKKLGVTILDPKIHHPNYLCERSVKWSRTADSNILMGELSSSLTPAQTEQVNQIIAMRVSEIVAARDKAQESTSTDAIIDFDIPSAANKKKHKRGENGNNLDERSELVKLKTTKSKLAKIQSIVSDYDNGALTEGARKFLQKQASPILACFQNHCNANVDTFCCRWPVLKHTNFPCKGREGQPCAFSG
jgi:hypothetical protein